MPTGITNTAAVAPHIMAEIIGEVLEPLFRKYTALRFLNRSNIDGDPTMTRSIPIVDAIATAYPDIEGAAPGPPEQLVYGDVNLTPAGWVQWVLLTMKAARRAMPGATRDQVIAAVEAGNEDAIGLIKLAASLVSDAHFRAAEIETLALANGISRTVGTTNTPMTIAKFLDAQTRLLNGDSTNPISGKPAHEEMVAILDEIGVSQLRQELVSGTGSALSGLWANPQTDLGIFNLKPDTMREGLRGGIAGTAIYAADGALMPQTGTDIVGMMILVGRGETGAPGSQRGFAEFCEGHNLRVEFSRDMMSDNIPVVGRWEWAVGEHTDLHGVRMLYRKT